MTFWLDRLNPYLIFNQGQFLRLSNEMQGLVRWDYGQKFNYMPVAIFFACFDFERKSSLIRLIDRKEVYDEVRNFFHRHGPHSSFDNL